MIKAAFEGQVEDRFLERSALWALGELRAEEAISLFEAFLSSERAFYPGDEIPAYIKEMLYLRNIDTPKSREAADRWWGYFANLNSE